ncbi:MAG: hypothetical protein HZA94_01950 [Candidatus Vogelbacteria bacterium]|nr:hypothetical protein [Candidatus Vogelbacteria bacterium]
MCINPEDLGQLVGIIVEHESLYGEVTRRIGDSARIYQGQTFGCLSDNEIALVFEGEDSFCGTDGSYFMKII